MTSSTPSVAVVILNWNSARDTVACVESLRKSEYPGTRLIVIDNHSSDDSLAILRSLASRHDFLLIEAGENLGFPGGCNLGMRRALADAADYVFLLNNDTVIAPDAIGLLVAAAERDPGVALVTPKILFFDPADLVWFGGADYDSRFVVGRQVGYKLPDDGRYDRQSDVPWATGCAMLIRRATIDKVGLLNEDYFFGAEDLDYSLRVTTAGDRIRYVPAAKVWHKEAAAAGGREAPAYVYYQVRNVLLLRRIRVAGVVNWLTAAAFSCAWIAKRSLVFLARARWRCLAAIGLGVWDHLRKEYGRHRHALLAGKPSPAASA